MQSAGSEHPALLYRTSSPLGFKSQIEDFERFYGDISNSVMRCNIEGMVMDSTQGIGYTKYCR